MSGYIFNIWENANTPPPQIFIAIRRLHGRDGNNVDFFVPLVLSLMRPVWNLNKCVRYGFESIFKVPVDLGIILSYPIPVIYKINLF